MRKRVAVGMVVALAMVTVGLAESNSNVVVVTATRTAKGVEDIAASVDVMSREQVEQEAAVNVDELFRRVGGVDLQGSGMPGAAIKLNMRGLTPGFQSKRVLVLMDGRRINEQYQGNAEFALLPADGLERVEVLRGPASALYGSGAMGGVIQLFSLRGRDVVGEDGGDHAAMVRQASGTHDTHHLQFWQGGVMGATDYFVNGSFVETDGYLQNSDGSDRDWQAWRLGGNMGWATGEESELRAFAGIYHGRGLDNNSLRTAEKDYEQLDWMWNWDSNRDAQLVLRAWRNADEDTYEWVYPGTGVYDQETLGAEAQQSLWLGDRNLLTAGLEVREESVDIDEVTGPINESTSVVGAYLQDEIIVNEALDLSVGVRYDNTGGYGEEWSPRAGAVLHPCEKMDIYGSINIAHRAPGLSDRFVMQQFNDMLFVGNPDLAPETLTAYEVGARVRPGDRVQLSLALFRNDMDDSFDFTLDPDGVFRVRNVTESRTQGAEASFSVRLCKRATLFGNWSYTEGVYEESAGDPRIEDHQLAYLAPNKGALGLDIEGLGRTSHSLICRYVGRRYGDATNTEANRMDDYAVADWRGRYHATENLDLTLNVNNIFDTTYEDFPGVEQPGTVVMAGVEGRF